MKPSEAAALLKSADNILIITHKKPDGDTIGSASALCHALRKLGKNVYLFKNAEVTKRLLPYCERYFAPEDFIAEYYLSVDVADTDMVAVGADFTYDLVIDHHPTNPQFGKNNCIDAKKSSSGEIVLDVIKSLNGSLDKSEANLLYIAISTDTGCFQYSNTNSDTFFAASELLEYGAQNSKLNEKFFRKVTKERINLESRIYGGFKYYSDGKVVVSTITREMISSCGASEDDLEDVAGLPGRVEGEIVGIVIRENDDGTCKISMRSKEEVNSSEICAYFGGGGHKMAAGCTIEAEPEKAEKLIIEVLQSVWTDFS